MKSLRKNQKIKTFKVPANKIPLYFSKLLMFLLISATSVQIQELIFIHLINQHFLISLPFSFCLFFGCRQTPRSLIYELCSTTPMLLCGHLLRLFI